MLCRSWLRTGSSVVLIALCLSGDVVVAQEPRGELVQMVVELLQNKDKDMRSAALEQIRYEAKGPAATVQFANQLPKLTPIAQTELLRALATRGDSSAKGQVLSLFKTSNDTSIRSAAVEALGELGDPTDLPLLMTAINGESIEIQTAAKKSLARMRHASVNQLLIEAMKNEPATTQASLIEVLVARRAVEAMPQISIATVDKDSKVRRAAMNALAELGTVNQIPAMVQGILMAEKGGERDAAEKAVVNLCNRIEKPDLRAEPVLASRAKLDDASQLELLSVVAKIGGPKALEAVQVTMASTNPIQRDVGLKAFCNWPDPGISDQLAKMIETTSNANERGIEFKALVRLAGTRDKRSDLDRLSRFKQAMSLASSTEERSLVINKCRSAYSVDTMRFVLPFLDQPEFAEIASETIVELAHHREVREPNKAEFDQVLDRVLLISKDATTKDRAIRYKKGETWQRPKGS